MATEPTFNDGNAYERFMGRWSRTAGEAFLDWIRPQPEARWLDVGCGGGAFTELVLSRCQPASVCAVDPATQQIEHALAQPVGKRAEFRVADAQKLPYADASFDMVAAALVINFIPDRARALMEMRRVACAGGLVAGYVWDFAGERNVTSPMRLALQRIGVEPPPASAGTKDSALERLGVLFTQAGLQHVDTKPIDVAVTYPDFDDFWQSQTPSFNPLTSVITALGHADRSRVIESIKESVGNADGSIAYKARANAVMARVPM
jgi:SAM-dependent methyltransferase